MRYHPEKGTRGKSLPRKGGGWGRRRLRRRKERRGGEWEEEKENVEEVREGESQEMMC